MPPKEKVYPYVYMVESSRPRNLVAISPRIRNERLEWEDTGRGTSVSIKEILFSMKLTKENLEIPQQIEVLTEEGEEITLTYLTIELYDEKVKDFVAGQPDFINTEDLQVYYLTTNFDN